MNTFYNVSTNGNRYLFSGKELYKQIVQLYPDLKYKEITDAELIPSVIDVTDFLYDYFGIKNHTTTNNIIVSASEYLDSKTLQYVLFGKFMPYSIITDMEHIDTDVKKLFNIYDSLYIVEEYTYGGLNSTILNNYNDYKLFRLKLKVKNYNKKIRISEKINVVKNFSQQIVVFKDGYLPISKTNQCIDNLIYKGNFYPNTLSDCENKQTDIIVKELAEYCITNKILGIVSFDFMSDGTYVYLSEINPHKTASNIMLSFMYNHFSPYQITELEYDAINSVSIDKFIYKDVINPDCKWSINYIYNYDLNDIDNIKLINWTEAPLYIHNYFMTGQKYTIYFIDKFGSNNNIKNQKDILVKICLGDDVKYDTD